MSTTQSITLTPGQTFVLPAGAVVTGLFVDGAISVTSSCDNLPPPGEFVCGHFYMNIDDDDNPSHPNDEESTEFTSIKIGDTTYPLNGLLLDQTVINLNALLNIGAVFTFTSITRYIIDDDPSNDKRMAIKLYFKVPETLVDTLELIITGNSGEPEPTTQIYRPVEVGPCSES
jgi:hypothetical protein